ncbi:kinase-like domain-containing protein [Rhizophagus irregularis DAOM 181602=DAOM 197198]|uniref:Uncharacterized protein n=2 Tax=Rhizophagus irregularis TaxID=588596 RepID=A0A015J1C9_RHIIW|nr:hypothetical protein GLOIN_2v1785761 [Rhizophagus irregularis DAOM 181602=DAOM 197198]EXX60520.1 hypothetical protein RirG_179220 [Rhizophagus irregularis DAOM 197198w]POG62096.1 hypothetical protein GLOIN_2v1785761 [Rhizophagus irregularis DAOM 181602=DAOM 197198]GBC53550.1 kinase-like domain-containing protein [Rhizophagus irregularis DAOM 181602=DAOM 197198]|eukprot:XP_025168962.1 hypothetical protein GLOIN_2v1785761 [Rhizophagus irregularis DAOM 181602=DAOM 197198]
MQEHDGISIVQIVQNSTIENRLPFFNHIMTNIREDAVWAAFNRAYLSNYINCNNLDERHELRKQTIFTNESLTKDEKLLAIKLLNEDYDHIKILSNEGTKKNL